MLGLLKIGVFTVLWLPLAAVGLYALGLTIYRLVFSPLAKFPGPKLAALTRKYESYYEAVQNYEYLWKIKQMHQKYGRLLRFLSSLFFLIPCPCIRCLMANELTIYDQGPLFALARTKFTWTMSNSLIV